MQIGVDIDGLTGRLIAAVLRVLGLGRIAFAGVGLLLHMTVDY